MIDFSMTEEMQYPIKLAENIAVELLRPIARYYDEHEHERPWDFIETMWSGERSGGVKGSPAGLANTKPELAKMRHVIAVCVAETLSWGDAGVRSSIPGSGLGGAAIQAVGTAEQKQRFLTRFSEGEPKWGAMAMTEPQAGSDTARIRTSAKLSEDGKEWILNGEKIFVTGGFMAAKKTPGLVVVWATIDPNAGRAGMKSFVVESSTPGMTVVRLEKKHGIRASDTAAISLVDCRIPFDNILGSPEVAKPSADSNKGFAGAMKTFDATRPGVAAGACGIGRASLEFVKDYLEKQGRPVRYDVPYQQLTAIEKDVLQMESQLRAAWLLVLKAAWMTDQGMPNTLEASMCKVKAGQAVTWVTQKAVEILGPEGYSWKHLVEKWMRDAKINDLYEGTGQINRLIVARRLLNYTSKELQ